MEPPTSAPTPLLHSLLDFKRLWETQQSDLGEAVRAQAHGTLALEGPPTKQSFFEGRTRRRRIFSLTQTTIDGRPAAVAASTHSSASLLASNIVEEMTPIASGAQESSASSRLETTTPVATGSAEQHLQKNVESFRWPLTPSANVVFKQDETSMLATPSREHRDRAREKARQGIIRDGTERRQGRGQIYWRGDKLLRDAGLPGRLAMMCDAVVLRRCLIGRRQRTSRLFAPATPHPRSRSMIRIGQPGREVTPAGCAPSTIVRLQRIYSTNPERTLVPATSASGLSPVRKCPRRRSSRSSRACSIARRTCRSALRRIARCPSTATPSS